MPRALRLVTMLVLFACIASVSGKESVQLSSNQASVTLENFQSKECAFHGKFVQKKQFKGLEHALQSSGIFYYHCEQGVVWKTTIPIQETLVFGKEGQRNRIEDGKIKKLKSQQSRLLGELMVGLIGWQSEYIKANFDWSLNEQSKSQTTVALTPKKRSLKRAIKQLSLTKVSTGLSLQNDFVEIVMMDKKAQNIRISAFDFIALDQSTKCSASGAFTQLECSGLEFLASE